MLNRRFLIVLAAATLLSLVGCDKGTDSASAKDEKWKGEKADDKSEKAPADSETAKSPDTAKAGENAPGSDTGPTGTGPSVELLSPGSEPRKELRYQLAKGVETVDMTMTMAITMKMPGMNVPKAAMPPFKMTMKIDKREMVGDNAMKYGLEVTGVDVLKGGDPNIAKAIKSELKKAVGMKGTATMDHRGFTRDVELDLPASMPAQMRQIMEGTKQSMDQMSAPLPAEAVGVGGKWKVIQDIDQSGIALQQTTVYELVEFTSGGVRFKATTSQKAARQAAKMPGLPPGVNATLLKLEGGGKGEVELLFNKLMPKKASIDGVSNSSFEVSAQGQTQKMSVKAEMGMVLENK